VLKMLNVSNETVKATGEGSGVAIDQKSGSQLSWADRKRQPFQTRVARIITCSRLFLTHQFSLSSRVFFAVPG